MPASPLEERESSRLFRLMLQGKATTEEYVAALKREVRERRDADKRRRPRRRHDA